MSLFTCPECGYLDNTAGSGYHVQRRDSVERPLCSQCNPETTTTSTRAMNLRP